MLHLIMYDIIGQFYPTFTVKSVELNLLNSIEQIQQMCLK